MNAENAPNSVFRLSWAATAASLTAFTALFVTEHGSLALPLLAIALVASRFWRYRLGSEFIQFGPLLALLFVLVFATNLLHAPIDALGLYDIQRAGLFGELCAALLVMEAWRKRPDAGGQGVIAILLSALVLWAATNSFDDRYMPVFVPLYMLFLALALRNFAPSTEPRRAGGLSRSAYLVSGAALCAALLTGAGTFTAFHVYRNELTDWGNRLLNETARSTLQTTGLSRSPRLGSTFGLEGSSARVLRVEGASGTRHLRALSFDVYTYGRWGPARDNRTYVPANAVALAGNPRTPGSHERITRLVTNDDILCMPLNAAGLDFAGCGDIEWAREEGGPIRTDTPAPSTYEVTAGTSETYQGPLCVAPGPSDLRRLLYVPHEIDRRVKTLAVEVAAPGSDPADRAALIVSYLMSHHAYSLRYRPPSGDPASGFILSSSAAHCEYFASAASLMLRCIGIPARYVIGYYAHEPDGPGTEVVRQCDAHAWTEAWIEGIGWVTLDATPADGRPDRTEGTLPLWQRATEWLQDEYARVTHSRSAMLRMAAILLTALAVSASVALWRRKRASAPAPAFAYFPAGEELAALLARFEAACLSAGVTCPAGKTWSETLDTAAATGSRTRPLNVERARRFVQRYNAARFGPPSPDDLAGMRELLQNLIEPGA